MIKEKQKKKFLIPFENKWAIVDEDRIEPSFLYHDKKEAFEKAVEIARAQQAILVINRTDGTKQDVLYYN